MVTHREGYEVNRKRVQRFMRIMGPETIYPKPNLSRPDRENRVYPYVLRGIHIGRSDRVRSTDIT